MGLRKLELWVGAQFYWAIGAMVHQRQHRAEDLRRAASPLGGRSYRMCWGLSYF